jgi:predicted nucleic acid-binding Zn ribbon protein
MLGPSAPLPPRQTVMNARRPAGRSANARAQMVTTIAFFIVGLSIVLSFNWTNGGFRPDAATTILFGILVAAFIFVGARYASANSAAFAASPRLCPACGRAIPADVVLCPDCGQRLS